jgi:hypothetical protein
MARRTWFAAGIVVVVLAVGFAVGRSRLPAAPVLRSGHSRPAATVPSGLVAVTPAGRLFHDPGCKYIHGPVEMMPAKKAVQEGYTPCLRCMRRYSGG